MRRVLVCGGRKYGDTEVIFSTLDHYHRIDPIGLIINGRGGKADGLSTEWAKARGIPFKEYPADWKDLSHPGAVIRTLKDGSKYDAMAGPRRNQRMLDESKPDMAVAFQGGDGTKDMVDRCLKANVLVCEVFCEPVASDAIL